MTSSKVFLSAVLVLVAIPLARSLPQQDKPAELNEVEFVAKAGKPYSGPEPSVRSRKRYTAAPEPGSADGKEAVEYEDSEDFTMTGNPALDTSIISTIGTIASSLIKSLFGGRGDSREGRGSGISGFFNTLFCKIFGGLFSASASGETCGTGAGAGDSGAYPVNVTSEQMKMLEDYMYGY